MTNDKRLIWRCRRGVRELDVLFSRFLELEYCNLNEEQRAAFERLLEVQDPIIMDWLFSKSHPQDSELFAIVELLQALSGLQIGPRS